MSDNTTSPQAQPKLPPTWEQSTLRPQPSVSAEPHDEWAAFLTWRDDYSRHSDPCAWPAWQARAALNPPPPSAPYVPLTRIEIWRVHEMNGWFPHDHYRLEELVKAIERIVAERMTQRGQG